MARATPGRFKIQVAGPWTLAATVERPRGDRVLADRGARRELAQALAEGLGDTWPTYAAAARMHRLIVQVDEPALPAVLAGRVPTASGFHRHRSVRRAGGRPRPWSGCSRRSRGGRDRRSRTAALPTPPWGC